MAHTEDNRGGSGVRDRAQIFREREYGPAVADSTVGSVNGVGEVSVSDESCTTGGIGSSHVCHGSGL